jgi:hypothetical protein
MESIALTTTTTTATRTVTPARLLPLAVSLIHAGKPVSPILVLCSSVARVVLASYLSDGSRHDENS